MPGTAAYLVIGAVAAVVTFAVTPIVGRIARRFGWVVEPDERRVHKVVTPDVGGGFGPKGSFYPEYIDVAVAAEMLLLL